MAQLTIIVATDAKQGIGIGNQLPWHLPEDLAHFKKTTSGHPIIMGRKTFESIGRPLPNRQNIVVSRQQNWQHTGVNSVSSIQDAIALLSEKEGFIIGGAKIYQQAMGFADKLIVTEIQAEFACDAFFPKIDENIWQEKQRECFVSANNTLHYAIVTYIRK
ncbi:MAG: dihydrofolate reductase [Burkholderiales bacterium]|nr:dihydrofolate reductase [Burkholderiales bacterium]